MRKPKFISAIVLLVIYCSCTTPPEIKYDAATLNLKGNIRHVTEKKANTYQRLEIDFNENRVIAIKTEDPLSEFTFEYDEQKLNNINYRGTHIKPEAFPMADRLLQPLYAYNSDSIVRNKYQDPIQIISSNKEIYRVEYTYDQFNNWVVREVYHGDNSYVLARSERTILYDKEVKNEEIANWNKRIDSIYEQSKIRSAVGTLIDSTIDKDKQRLKEIATYTRKYYNDAVSADTSVNALLEKFNKTYGQDRLSPELKKIQRKLNIVVHLALREKYLYQEVKMVIPLLASGKKTVTDTIAMAPFEKRYTLTYTFELLSDIKSKEAMYVSEED
ncbi:hypothetical protein SAMN05428949_1997 [Chitinophaga sp. YR627]|uniref:hypothetical protein n=1 Tax=Chitinophaga sp. YR627 TaxID=1881041 RepID=UPI0008F296B0|nr:hypothetical protein [Chitinophaga sp. YR627]SFN22155.1 hypothetical protein SAMN05428949_1997 [Chitinophaga sp. YR627]